MQWESRMHICVKDGNYWQKLSCVDLGKYNISGVIDDFVSSGERSLVFEWSLDSQMLERFVREIATLLREEAIIIADCSSYNTDPFTFEVYYLGDTVKSHEYSCLDDPSSPQASDEDSWIEWSKGKMWAKHKSVAISDMLGWIVYGEGIGLTEKENIALSVFGIDTIK